MKSLMICTPHQKWDEVPGKRKEIHDEDLYDLYSLPDIRVIKLRRMRWAGDVARMRRVKVCTGMWWGDLRETDHLADTGVDRRMILRWIFRKWDGEAWIGSSWLRTRTGGGFVNAVMNLSVP
jgi:hypothetical protein